jgi:peptidoglycan/LPS O-acetylase OafA/YrhL
MAEREHALDGLRGMAALSVVVAKLWADLPSAWHAVAPVDWAVYPPLRFLLNDRGAVILFFILSGYVLTLSLVRPGVAVLDQFAPFLMRRLCRIWLPYAVVLCASAVIGLSLHYYGRSEPAEWQPLYWQDVPQFTPLWRQLTLRYTIPPLNPPGWSLVTELLVSAVFPLLLVGVRRWPVGLCLLALAGNLARQPEDVQAFRFVVFFLAGSLLALHRTRIVAAVRPVLARWRLPTVVASLFGLGMAPEHWYSELCMAAGALAIMILALGPGRTTGFLLLPWVQTLGRVSYSLYLTHTVVVHAVAAWLTPAWPLWVALLASIPAIWLATWATYVLLERPSTRLGQMVAGAMRRPALA